MLKITQYNAKLYNNPNPAYWCHNWCHNRNIYTIFHIIVRHSTILQKKKIAILKIKLFILLQQIVKYYYKATNCAIPVKIVPM